MKTLFELQLEGRNPSMKDKKEDTEKKWTRIKKQLFDLEADYEELANLAQDKINRLGRSQTSYQKRSLKEKIKKYESMTFILANFRETITLLAD